MKELPANYLDPRIKNAWRINDMIWIVGMAVLVLGPAQLFRFIPQAQSIVNTITLVGLALVIVLLLLCVIVLPPIRYARWRYEVTNNYLDIAKGIFWRKRIIIPFIRVQNTDTRQGPIMRAFGLASVTVSTAAREHEIPGLDTSVAEHLRDQAAELARIAREDV